MIPIEQSLFYFHDELQVDVHESSVFSDHSGHKIAEELQHRSLGLNRILMSWCSHVDSFADVNLDYLTSIHELETASSHDMLSFPGKCLSQQFLPSLISVIILTCPQGSQLMEL